MVRNFKHQMDRLINKGASGTSASACRGEMCVPRLRIKSSFPVKGKGKALKFIFPLPKKFFFKEKM